MVGPGRAGFGVSASNSGLRWGVQAGMRGAEAVWACAHSWCPESRAPRHDVMWAHSGDDFGRFASMSTKRYYATYNPNHENKFTTHRCFSGEKEADAKSRTDGRWLLSFCQALEHTKRTGGCLVQVAAH